MIQVTSDPSISSTHHISLSDGKRTIGLIVCDSAGNSSPKGITRAPVNRTALKTSTGSTKWGDFEPPWSPVAQEEFSGGMGKKDFDIDVTRYMSADGVNAAFGKLFLGAQETLTKGYRAQDYNLPGSVTWQQLVPGTREYLAISFVASSSYNAVYIYLPVRRVGTPGAPITIELCSNTAGVPDTVLKTTTITTTIVTDIISEMVRSTITAQALTSGSTYWVKVYSSLGTDKNHWEVGVNSASGTTKQSANGTTWSTTNINLYFRVADSANSMNIKLFQYKNSEYMIKNAATGAPSLWINGDRGTADANTGALTTLVDASKAWAVNEWAGCVVKVTNGLGLAEETNYRTIVSNTTTVLTLSSTWTITQDTTTEYVILGSNKWVEITGHGLTAPVTDILVVNNIIYMAMGDSVNIRCMKFDTQAGTWTPAYADDGTNKAMFLETVRDATGLMKIWRGNNSDANGLISVGCAKVQPWGTNLVFSIALTGTTTYGSKIISGLSSNADITVGMLATGTGVGANPNAVASVDTDLVYRMSGGTTSGNKIITGLSSTSYLTVGMFVTGTGIGAAPNTIASIDSATQVTLTVNSTATATVIVMFASIQVTLSTMSTASAAVTVTFSSVIPMQDQWGRITGLVEYDNKLWIMREGTVNAVSGVTLEEIKLTEIRTMMETTNGQAQSKHNVYMYFNLGSGVERYYNGSLDDVGPNRDDGLPADRQGIVSALLGYPGRYFAAIDGGPSNYSSILMNNGVGWHDVYKGTTKGDRIKSLDFQAIPGLVSDRMWVQVGGDIYWIPFPSLSLDPTNDTNYRYRADGVFISGYMYSGMVDAYKYYQSLKLFTQNLSADSITIKADYQVDNDTSWTIIEGEFDTSPMQELTFKETLGVIGKSLRIRLRLNTNDNTKSPIIKTTVVENVSRVAIKYSYAFMYRMKDMDIDIDGHPTSNTAETCQAIIDEWAENLTPLVQRCVREKFDNKTVFMDPPSTTPLYGELEGYLERTTVVER